MYAHLHSVGVPNQNMDVECIPTTLAPLSALVPSEAFLKLADGDGAEPDVEAAVAALLEGEEKLSKTAGTLETLVGWSESSQRFGAMQSYFLPVAYAVLGQRCKRDAYVDAYVVHLRERDVPDQIIDFYCRFAASV